MKNDKNLVNHINYGRTAADAQNNHLAGFDNAFWDCEPITFWFQADTREEEMKRARRLVDESIAEGGHALNRFLVTGFPRPFDMAEVAALVQGQPSTYPELNRQMDIATLLRRRCER